MNLGDPELEYIDPTPNIHTLFIHFDQLFFWTKLASRAVVRWSKRMYSCAGICSYEGRGGLCDIALSEPLLKLRPRKNLVETLLHEMIHAYLFVCGRDRDRDGHGPNFQSHMHRINKAAGVKITIYHDFHDEVKLYQKHVWRCDGPCQNQKPYFGIVRRSMNRAPGPTDFWWDDHKRKCDGNFVKIKEPEKVDKKKAKTKTMGDITKFVNNTTNTSPVIGGLKSNGSSTVVVTNQKLPKTEIFKGTGHKIADVSKSTNNPAETVRNVWASKTLPANTDTKAIEDVAKKVKEIWANKQINLSSNNKSRKTKSLTNTQVAPNKIPKIDDYFKRTSAVLKDIYGDDFQISRGIENKSTKAPNHVLNTTLNNDTVKTTNNNNLVNCPICDIKVKDSEINQHIDECLNKEEINKIVNAPIPDIKPSTSWTETIDLVNIEVPIKRSPKIPHFTSNKITVDDMRDFVEKVNKQANPDVNDAQKCPCCDLTVYKPMEEHMEECLAFITNDDTIPEEGASTSFIDTIVIEDEVDEFDESVTMNQTGTKTPCPICLKMVESGEMNDHLDVCLSS